MVKSVKCGIERITALSVGCLTAEHFEQLKNAGVDAIEISMADKNYPLIDWRKVVRTAEETDLLLWSFHLPFSPFYIHNIASTDAFVRKTTVDYLKVLMDRAAGYAGIRTLVVHASGEPIAPETRAARMEYAKEGLAQLCEAAASYGAVLAVEDLPRTCLGKNAEEIQELLHADERLRVCFDTNHLLGGRKPQDFIRALGDKIVTVHFSDYDGVDERHWMPGEGIIDWNAVMDALDDIGYRGPVLYELGYSAPATITRPRDFTPEDFVRNHEELEARHPLTVIGTPVRK